MPISTRATTAKAARPEADGSESLLGGIANASGPVVVVTLVIAAMSFYLIALVVWMALNYRSSTTVPPGLVRDVQDLLDQTKYNEAYHRLVADSSFLARVLAAGVRKLPAGLVQAQRASELANEGATMEMEHRTTYLATVGTLGPMIGLVGTVYGMIIAFRVIARRRLDATGKPACRRDFDGALFHARGNRDLDSSHLFLCDVSQPDRAAVAGGGHDGRAPARAIRARRSDAAATSAGPSPAPAPAAHPHPLPSVPHWPPRPIPRAPHCRAE